MEAKKVLWVSINSSNTGNMDYAAVVLGAVFWESSDGRDAGEPCWAQGDQGIILNERFVTSVYWSEDSVCGWCVHTKLQLRLPSLLGVTGWCAIQGSQSSTT